MTNKTEEKRLVALNDEVYELSIKRFEQIFELNKPIRKHIKVLDDEQRQKQHQRLCDKIRRYGKVFLKLNWMLRDD